MSTFAGSRARIPVLLAAWASAILQAQPLVTITPTHAIVQAGRTVVFQVVVTPPAPQDDCQVGLTEGPRAGMVEAAGAGQVRLHRAARGPPGHLPLGGRLGGRPRRLRAGHHPGPAAPSPDRPAAGPLPVVGVRPPRPAHSSRVAGPFRARRGTRLPGPAAHAPPARRVAGARAAGRRSWSASGAGAGGGLTGPAPVPPAAGHFREGPEPRSQLAEEGHQVGLLLGAQAPFQHQVEKIHGVLQGEQAAVVQVRRAGRKGRTGRRRGPAPGFPKGMRF